MITSKFMRSNLVEANVNTVGRCWMFRMCEFWRINQNSKKTREGLEHTHTLKFYMDLSGYRFTKHLNGIFYDNEKEISNMTYRAYLPKKSSFSILKEESSYNHDDSSMGI
jgi:aminopeptidase C